MSPKKPKTNPADQFLEDNVAAIAAAVDTVAPEISPKVKKSEILTRRLTVRIDEALYERLWAARGIGERSMVEIVTAALEQYLEPKRK